MTKICRAILIITILNIFLVNHFSYLYAIDKKKGNKNSPENNLSINDLMKKVEERYFKKCFSANFLQESTLKAMGIIDNAKGSAFFKHPGKMLWKYDEPEIQVIVTDGKKLWIYRPEDKQVMIGEWPNYFGKGKGASFLTDIEILRESFFISYASDSEIDISDNNFYSLKLIPKISNSDFSSLYLKISKKNYEIQELISYNAYEDKTKIQFKDLKFHKDLLDSQFNFNIPEGSDVIQMDN